MGDESTTPLVMEFIRASEVVITVHQALSREEFRSPDLNFTVWSPTALSSRRRQAQVGRKGIGDAPIFFVPAIVIRLARPGQKLEKRSDEVVWWFGGWTCPVQRIRALAVSSAVREKFSCEQNFS